MHDFNLGCDCRHNLECLNYIDNNYYCIKLVSYGFDEYYTSHTDITHL